ncbi:MAG: methyl-accepting chemotaxis protein [Ignavibacteria bacterium]|nr:methyl-accepting chemotaxis protein [Ignavibacteria bacterium]
MMSKNSSTDFLQVAQGNLSKIDTVLRKANSIAEKEFVIIGDILQTHYADSKHVKEICEEIAQVFSSQILAQSNTRLEEMFSKINSYLEHLENELSESTDILKIISGILDLLRTDLEGYDRIIKYLRMLGISTRIESVRLFHENNSFEVIATNVDSLSGVVQDKVNAIKENIKQLTASIQTVDDKIRGFHKGKDERTREIMAQIENCMGLLKDNYRNFSSKINLIRDDSELITRNTSYAVSNIQFHDITRQQIEHVLIEVHELTDQIGSGKSEKEGLIAYVNKVCRLQVSQLENSQQTLINAVADLKQNLSAIGGQVDEVFNHTLSIIGSKDASSIKFLEDIGEYLKEVNIDLEKSNALSIDLSDSIKNVLLTAEKLSTFIFEIEEIGTEIELIALNASIKAAHTGKEGAGLGVIADTIQKISAQATNQSETTAVSLRKITDISERIQTNIEANYRIKLFEELSLIHDQLGSQLAAAKDSETEIMKKIRNLQNESKSLSSSLNQAVARITIDATVSKSIQEAIHSMEELTGTEHIAGVTSGKELMSLRGKYTMKSERDIHASFEGKKDSARRPGHDRLSLKDTSFGDNVELF